MVKRESTDLKEFEWSLELRSFQSQMVVSCNQILYTIRWLHILLAIYMSTKYSTQLHILLDEMNNVVSKLYAQIIDDNSSKY